jgi:iron complex transport system substrate-binding protein
VKVHLIEPEQKDTFKFFLSTKPTIAPNDYTFLKVPIKDLSVLSATQIGMLEKLGAVSAVKAIADERYIFSPALRTQVKNGKSIVIGQLDNISIERLLQSSAKAVVFSGFSGEFPNSDVLRKAGIEPVPIFDWKEKHPLGKAEWIKLIGYLVGKQNEAIDYFKQLETRYNQLKKDYSKRKGPSVLCGNLTGDIWYTPAGESYHAQLLKDAGANYRYSSTKGVGSLSFSLERVIKDNLTTQFWLNPGIPELNRLAAIHPLIEQFSSVKTAHVFCYSQRMNKYWELAAIEPDKVLSDFVQIFYSKGKEKLYFYQKVTN